MLLWMLPISMAVIGITGFWAVFWISVANGTANLTRNFPMISGCANISPQSCYFTQTCNILSGLAMWIMAIRYQQVKDYGDHGRENIVSFVVGILAAIGMSVTGNFQSIHFKTVHFLGAVFAFVFGLIYFWIQLYLTFWAHPDQDRHWMGPVRGVCCALGTLCFIGMSFCIVCFTFPTEAAVFEWSLTMIILVLYGLFASEFRHIDCYRLTVQKKALKALKCDKKDTMVVNK